ncbi:ribosomal RNA small subunit methyltransferase I [Clostridia bacterium]|nr:ribosomal RNA small subunit methyltransferase I [Clostridia bacterium]
MKTENKPRGGTLYVVATPIGNLGDMTYRAVSTLREVDFIAAEDTRVTGKLLSAYEIKTPLMAYHAHNFSVSGNRIISRLLSGYSCAIVTDAGMPCISDPGEDLVRLCRESGIDVRVVPGACAAVSALAVSGLPTANFTFIGFVSVSERGRRETLERLTQRTETLIFYEAPHKLRRTLRDFARYFPGRRLSLCRELTKVYEEVISGTTDELALRYADEQTVIKGEFVLILQGKQEDDTPPDTDAALAFARMLTEDGIKKSEAAKQAAEKYGVNRRTIYESLTKS